jgi:GH24 family phage-related lysozyme (muramidase)
MNIGTKGKKLIRKYEGYRLTAYDDLQPEVLLKADTKIIGKLTIGIGHTGNVHGKPIKWNTVITPDEVNSLFKLDIAKAEKAVNKYDKIYHWKQHEYDALCDFALNVGSIEQLTADGTRTKEVIAKKILKYNHCDGVVMTGLTKRRKDDKLLFEED